MGGGYLLSALARGIDARCDGCDVFRQLLRALGIDVHFFGHGAGSSPTSRV